MHSPRELRIQLESHEKMLNDLQEEISVMEEGVSHIDIDLSNTVAEFVESTGRQSYEFYKWRRKAKWARHHKIKAITVAQERVRAYEEKVRQTQLLLHAVESGYRGQDPHQLLSATYHLLMEVLSRSDYTVDAHQMGLIAAIRLSLGIDKEDGQAPQPARPIPQAP